MIKPESFKNYSDIPKDYTGVALVNGSENWFKNGELYRLDGPAKTSLSMVQGWYIKNIYHRMDGPARKDLITNEERYYIKGKIFLDENEYKRYLSFIKSLKPGDLIVYRRNSIPKYHYFMLEFDKEFQTPIVLSYLGKKVDFVFFRCEEFYIKS